MALEHPGQRGIAINERIERILSAVRQLDFLRYRILTATMERANRLDPGDYFFNSGLVLHLS